MPSIKQNPPALALPDFRNFGVMLRILLGANLFAAAAALVLSGGIIDWPQRYVDLAAWVQPILLIDLALLALLNGVLRRLPARLSIALVIGLTAALSAAQLSLWNSIGLEESDWSRQLRVMGLGGLAAGLLLYYFALRNRAFSPAVTEARLQALTARIRPHFLFNSLNAVLSLIRSEPQRAETALEELAELFRALMRDHRDLLPLADEIALCRQYLDLEKLRLGDRLRVEWIIDKLPEDLPVPPLMLQPLIENAVYHGIEPSGEPGTLRIQFSRTDDELWIELTNPCAGAATASGNRMALANIRERLALYYDLEARLETQELTREDGQREYRVRIALPCRRSAT